MKTAFKINKSQDGALNISIIDLETLTDIFLLERENLFPTGEGSPFREESLSLPIQSFGE